MNQQHGDRDKRKEGGSGNFKQDRERASEAGRKGGQQSQGGKGQEREFDQKKGGQDDRDMERQRGGGGTKQRDQE